MQLFRKFFHSFSTRMTLLLCLAYGIAMLLIMALVAIHVTPVIRHDYEHRAEAAIKAALANMDPADRALLTAGAVPGDEAKTFLSRALAANGLPGVVFWRQGTPLLTLGKTGDLSGTGRMLMERAAEWRGKSDTFQTPDRRALLVVPTPGRTDDPLTVIMPYKIIRDQIGLVMQTFINPPLIAAAVGLMLGLLLMRYLNRHLRAVSKIAGQVASGNLKTPVPKIGYEDSLGVLYREIHRMQDSLRTLVQNLSQAAGGVTVSSNLLEGAAKEASRSSQSMALTMSEITTGINELTATIQAATRLITDMASEIDQSSKAAGAVSHLAQETLSSSEGGQSVVEASIQEVKALAEYVQQLMDVAVDLRSRSTDIEGVVEFIDTVAEQTGLLALNASIEAARAGEAGSAFGLLAERIQMLSTDAGMAGSKIGGHIKGILEGIDHVDEVTRRCLESFTGALNQTGRAGEFFAQIGQMIRETTIQIGSVSKSSLELLRRGEQASGHMQSIAALSEEMAAAVEEVASASEEQAATSTQVGQTALELVSMANGIKTVTQQFEI